MAFLVMFFRVLLSTKGLSRVLLLDLGDYVRFVLDESSVAGSYFPGPALVVSTFALWHHLRLAC